MRKTIQQAIVETAQGLRDAGVMDEVTLREMKALSLPRQGAQPGADSEQSPRESFEPGRFRSRAQQD